MNPSNDVVAKKKRTIIDSDEETSNELKGEDNSDFEKILEIESNKKKISAQVLSEFVNADENIENEKTSHKKKPFFEEFEDIDDDDYELLEENLGKFSGHSNIPSKRLRRKAEANSSKDKLEVVQVEMSESEEYSDGIEDFIVERGKNLKSKGTQDHSEIYIAEELFGNEDKEGEDFSLLSQNEQPTDISEIFEPDLLRKEHLTIEDKVIKLKDIPERFQILDFPSSEETTNEELELEVDWIFFNWNNEDIHQRKVCTEILPESSRFVVKNVLSYFRIDFYEVPFIQTYRRQTYYEHLEDEDIWSLLDWDVMWRQFYKSKKNIFSLISSIPKTLSHEELKINESKIENVHSLIDNSFTVIELNDIRAYICFLFGSPSSKTLNQTRIKKGLEHLCEQFGLETEKLAENFMKGVCFNKIFNAQDTPYVTAEKFKTDRYRTPEGALVDARTYLSYEIANHPIIRKKMRKIYEDEVVLSVYPTKKGQLSISEHHPCYSIRYLKNIPVAKLHSNEIFVLFNAENEKLVHLQFECESSHQFEERNFFQFCYALYSEKHDISIEIKLWNEQRKAILVNSFQRILFPIFEKELRQKMRESSEKKVVHQCCLKFRNYINKKSFVDENSSFDLINGDRQEYFVMGVSSGSFPSQINIAVVNSIGKVERTLVLDHFREKSGEKEKDIRLLKDLISEFNPKVIGISCEGKEAFFIFSDFEKILDEMEMNQRPGLEHVSGEVARIYMDSPMALQSFPDHSSQLRHSISISRRLLNPLAEIAQLSKIENGLAMLKLHPQQRFVPSNTLQLRLEEEIIKVVSKTGIRINDLCSNDSMESLLQYLPALGPRKAKYLLETIRKKNYLSNRYELITLCRIGPCVFNNVAGFIRIDLNDPRFDENDIKVLDCTRIHPENYDLAKKMTTDALDEFNDLESEECINSILKNKDNSAHKLDLLDLDEFAKLLEKEGKPNLKLILYQIKSELHHPFQDNRPSYRPLEYEERFELVTSQSVDSFEVNSVVTAQISYVSNDTAFARADGVIDGIIHKENVSDKIPNNMKDILHVGQTCSALILHVNIKSVQLVLSINQKEIDAVLKKECEKKSRYFDEEKWKSDQDEKKLKELQNLKKKGFCRRAINHPSFKNLDFRQAEEYLMELDVGECVFRPSSQKPNQITLTWKIDDNVFQHLPIIDYSFGKSMEENRQFIGKYKLKDEFYEDLDEILSRFLAPRVDLLNEVKNSPCYHKPLIKTELDTILRNEKRKTPIRIPYYLSCSVEYPGTLMLSYLPTTNTVLHEYVSLTAEGLRYNNKTDGNVSQLIKRFKLSQTKVFEKNSESNFLLKTKYYK